MKKEEIDFIDQLSIVMDIALRLTEIGIANKKEPEEVVDYFIKLTEGFSKKIEEMKKL